MSRLTIEFTGRITANDNEIKAALDRANEIFRAAGTTAEKAYEEQSTLWSKANYAATKDMGEGAALAFL